MVLEWNFLATARRKAGRFVRTQNAIIIHVRNTVADFIASMTR